MRTEKQIRAEKAKAERVKSRKKIENRFYAHGVVDALAWVLEENVLETLDYPEP